MVTNYYRGINRIWYRASGFKTGVVVQVRLRQPIGIQIDALTLTESEDKGLYYLDFDFSKEGQWVGIFFEDGLKIASDIFHVTGRPHNMFVQYNSSVKKE
jgi:hypothetical protein